MTDMIASANERGATTPLNNDAGPYRDLKRYCMKDKKRHKSSALRKRCSGCNKSERCNVYWAFVHRGKMGQRCEYGYNSKLCRETIEEDSDIRI